jgi:hypothetical protein
MTLDQERKAHGFLQYYVAIVTTALTVVGGFSTYLAHDAYSAMKDNITELQKETKEHDKRLVHQEASELFQDVRLRKIESVLMSKAEKDLMTE